MRTNTIHVYRIALTIALTLLVDGFAGSPEDTRARARETMKTAVAPQLQLIVELRDGSRLVGVPSVSSVPIQTSFAKIDLPLKIVDTIEFTDDRERVKVSCANGDLLQGVLNLSALQLATSFGKVSVVLKDIARISRRATGIPHGRVLYYPFDEDEGSIVTDRSDSGIHGKVRGVTWTRSGAIGGAMSFDGNGCIEIDDLSCVQNKQAFSYGAWVYPTRRGLQGVMGKTMPGDDIFTLVVNFENNRSSYFACVTPPGQTDGRCIDVLHRLQNNTWQFLMITYDGTRTRSYYNGELAGTSEARSKKPSDSNNVKAAIGDTASGRGWRFHGKIDEVMIFDHCLVAEEVKQIYRLRSTAIRGDETDASSEP